MKALIVPGLILLSGCGYHLCADDYSADFKASHDVQKLDQCLAVQGEICESQSRNPIVLPPVDKPKAENPVQ